MFLHLIALAWMYVVLMMAAAEALSPNGTLLGAFVTLLLYGLAPLALVLYILATPARRRARRAAEASARTDAEAQAQAQAAALAAQRDGSGQTAGETVAPERKEP